ncbi:MAG: glycerophosphodiester phosphodiesterase family protein [Candidatus Kapabacteria bacterium]|nr:glycerophosphodiester phosphodiesterase family protein [Candidatus Kapabacteria bacterium]
MIALKEFAKTDKILIVAHRGSSGTAPENTLSAFKQALEAGANMIEADIQVTSDNEIVVFHDKGLSRTTDGSGFTKNQSLSEIKSLDAGSWFDEKFSGERIPLLSEVLELINNKAYLNLEIKNINNEHYLDNLNKILSILFDFGYQDKALISSFYYNSLKYIKSQFPEIPTAAIKIPKDNRLPSEIANEIACDAFVCSITEINDEIVQDALNNNIYVGIYSIDKRDDLITALNFKAKAIVTNYPAKIIEELKSLSLI